MTTDEPVGENARTATLIASLRAAAELAMEQRDEARADRAALTTRALLAEAQRDALQARVESLQAALGKTLADYVSVRDSLKATTQALHRVNHALSYDQTEWGQGERQKGMEAESQAITVLMHTS